MELRGVLLVAWRLALLCVTLTLRLLQVSRPVYRTRGESENVVEDMRAKLQEALSNIKKVPPLRAALACVLNVTLLLPPRASTRGRSRSPWIRLW